MATASTITKSAPLSGEFGLEYATRLFGAEAIASLPVLKSGPNKGKPKGHLCWVRTTSAGYHPNVGGGVAAGVTVRAWIAPNGMAHESAAMRGQWLGRVQELCGSRHLLSQAYRDQHAAEVAAVRAEAAAADAEFLASLPEDQRAQVLARRAAKAQALQQGGR